MKELLCVVCLLAASLPWGSSAAVTVTRGPYLQGLLAHSVSILWKTDEPSLGRVRLVPERGEPRIAAEAEPAIDHELPFLGLDPGTSYHYEVFAGEEPIASGEDFRFRTAPPPGDGTFRVALTGDSGWGGRDQHAVAALLADMQADLFLHTGDLIYLGDLDSVVFSVYGSALSRSCLYATRGNHTFIPYDDWHAAFSPPPPDRSLDGCDPPAFACDEPLPPGRRRPVFYSFEWGSAHFAVVDSNADFDQCSAQIEWLCADLAAARTHGTRWLVIMLHEHPYTTGSNDPGKAREVIPPIADRFEVDLVLSGHDHNYQRSHPVRGHQPRALDEGPFYLRPPGTVYVVTGGGGGIRYAIFEDAPDHDLFKVAEMVYHAVELEVSPERLEVRATRTDGTELDHFILGKTRDSLAVPFVRGDVSFDGGIDLADAVRILQFLFAGEAIPCVPVADASGRSGEPLRIDIADPVFLLNYLFLGSAPPTAPFPDCGTAAGVDRFNCRCTCGQGCPGT